MRRFLAVALGVGALLISAQAARAATLAVHSFNGVSDSAGTYARSNCPGEADDDSVRVRVRLSDVTQPALQARWLVFHPDVADAPCSQDLSLTDSLLDDGDITLLVDWTELTANAGVIDEETLVAPLLFMGDDACDDDGVRVAEASVCLQVANDPGDASALLTDWQPLSYDTALPPLPSIDDIKGKNGGVVLTVSPTEGDDGDDYQPIALVTSCNDSDCTDLADDEKQFDGNADGVINITTSEKRINIVVFLVDDFGNVGPSADAINQRITLDRGALSLYDGNGSSVSASPSCETSGAALLGFVSLAGLARRTRRARQQLVRARRAAWPVVLVVIACATSARADFGQVTLGAGLSPYKPAIDSETVRGKKIFPIYDCFFDDATVAQGGVDVDGHLWDGFGSLQLSFGMNLAQASGFAQPSSTTTTCKKSTTTTVELTMVRARPGLVYRFDPLLDWVGIPFVPYVRAGLIAQGYLFTHDTDFDSGGSEDPLGLRFGWEASAGMMLALDFLDAVDPFTPGATRRARANGVFDHSFLFVDASWQDVSDFGQPGFVFTPEDDWFGTGMPVLWRIGLAVELL